MGTGQQTTCSGCLRVRYANVVSHKQRNGQLSQVKCFLQRRNALIKTCPTLSRPPQRNSHSHSLPLFLFSLPVCNVHAIVALWRLSVSIARAIGCRVDIVEESLVEHKVIGLRYGAQQAVVLAQKAEQLLRWTIHRALEWRPLFLL